MIRCELTDPYEGLGRDWVSLQRRGCASFFTSWVWVENWLYTYAPLIKVLRVMRGEQLIGLGMMAFSTRRVLRIAKVNCCHLHQTGEQDLDQIWIEHNNFVTLKGCEAEVVEAALEFLAANDLCNELVVSGISVAHSGYFNGVADWQTREDWSTPAYGVNLKALREAGSNYLASLSRNSRANIRRSMRAYQTQGRFEVEYPKDAGHAVEMFLEQASHHIARWGAGRGQSGFANPHFVEFHTNLIRRRFNKRCIDIIRLRVDSEPVAYFYNFRWGKTVYFYLGSLVPKLQNVYKPGLLGHAICIQAYLDEGFDYYDFMGGNERYKASLATVDGGMRKIVLRRSSHLLALEARAKATKDKLAGVFGE